MLERVGREGPKAVAELPPSPELRPGMREALRYRMVRWWCQPAYATRPRPQPNHRAPRPFKGKKRVLVDLLIAMARKVDLSMGM